MRSSLKSGGTFAATSQLASALALMLCLAVPARGQNTGAVPDYRLRPPTDDVVYFLLPDRFENADPSNDRGGLSGGRLKTGYDPTDKGFYHGGDLKGVIKRLGYIQALGATAIWIAPVFVNRPVQGPPGHESAGYHGYWITDFTHVDPHLGTGADYKALVDAAHARGMKVYQDIVVNHTADIIHYRECPDDNCPYRSRADYPYDTVGGPHGKPINIGFQGDGPRFQTKANFAHLTSPDYAYTPFIPKGEAHIKVPDWLNNPIYYHNRGNSTFTGESSTMGDFVGLDDLMTENPRVVRGMIDIYGSWIDKYGIDGFRIDTEKHVNPNFWRAFVPAIKARAKKDGIPNFFMFGEAAMPRMDPAVLAIHTRVDGMPSMLDFAFNAAVRETVAGKAGTNVFAKLFALDGLYQGGVKAAMELPIFVSNHDFGRFAYFVRKAFPKASDEEVMKRVILAHAMMFTLRGIPVVYYGDEQGFAGLGGDMASRQDMFPSKVASYNDDPLVGTKATTAASNFDTHHPIFRAIAALAHLRLAHPALEHGRQIVRDYSDKPGLLAVSRLDPKTGREILIAFNTSTKPLSAQVEVDVASRHFSSLHGTCARAHRACQLSCAHSAAWLYRLRRGRRPMSAPQKANAQAAPAEDWWRGAAIYQIYPRSFQDTNGDGVGDLPGIIARLDYVASLGVDAVWISPFFKSPMADFGYDVSDYRAVDPLFGTLEDFDRLLEKAHGLGLKVMIDQVLSHTSVEHSWFQESRQDRENAKADWYVWADPREDGTPPNNWLSIFGGTAWKWEPRRCQYYLHNFLAEQPDLNFHNPAVRAAMLDNVRFWLDRGVDGLRLDAINFCYHDRQLRNNPPKPLAERKGRGYAPDNPYAYQYHYYDNTQPEMLSFLGELRALLDRYPGAVALGEISAEDSNATMAEYTGRGRLHMAYSFELLSEDGSPAYIRATVEQTESAMHEGWPCWAISNHDVERVASRWSRGWMHPARATQLTALIASLRGTVCVFQGEELGLGEAEVSYDALRDPFGIEFWPSFKGRDGCRTPMPWTEARGAGFSDAVPWLPVSPAHQALAVEVQERDPNSALNGFRRFLRWHKQYAPLKRGDIAFVHADDQILAFIREFAGERILAAFNLSDAPATADIGADYRGATIGGHGLAEGTLSGRTLSLPAAGVLFLRLS